jgi:AcrR family transcriptional regulator
MDEKSEPMEDEAPDREPIPGVRFPRIDTIARPGATDEIRTEILQAAAETFVERGFAASSIDDVADTLGSTKGRIYHYYRSKSDLIIDLHLESLRILIDRVGAIAADDDRDPVERLYRMCFEHAAVLMTNISYQKATTMGLNRLLLSTVTEYQQEATKLIYELRDAYEKMFVRALEQGVQVGAFRNDQPRMLAKSIFGALNWTNLWFKPPVEDAVGDISNLADGLATFCVHAVVKSEAALTQEGANG